MSNQLAANVVVACVLGALVLLTFAAFQQPPTDKASRVHAAKVAVETLKVDGLAPGELHQVRLRDGTLCMVLLTGEQSGAISCDWSTLE